MTLSDQVSLHQYFFTQLAKLFHSYKVQTVYVESKMDHSEINFVKLHENAQPQ